MDLARSRLAGIFLATSAMSGLAVGSLANSSSAAAPPTPLLAKSHAGSANNVTAAEAGAITITKITQSGTKIAGTLAFGSPLAGTGPFSGTISSTSISFTVRPTSTSCPSCASIVFKAVVSPIVSMVGTWTAHLKSGPSQSGTWQVGSTWTSAKLSLVGVIETSTGTITGQLAAHDGVYVVSNNTGHINCGSGPLKGSISGRAIQFHTSSVASYADCPASSIKFTGTLNAALGTMGGNYVATVISNSTYALTSGAPQHSTFQVQRSGAISAV